MLAPIVSAGGFRGGGSPTGSSQRTIVCCGAGIDLKLPLKIMLLLKLGGNNNKRLSNSLNI